MQKLVIYKAKVAKVASHIMLMLAIDPRSFLWVAMATVLNKVAYVTTCSFQNGGFDSKLTQNASVSITVEDYTLQRSNIVSTQYPPIFGLLIIP